MTPEPAPAPDEAAVKEALRLACRAEAFRRQGMSASPADKALCVLADHIASLTTRLAEAAGRVEELSGDLQAFVGDISGPMFDLLYGGLGDAETVKITMLLGRVRRIRAALSGKG